MPIKIACPCGQRLTAKDELAGKRVKCPKCKQSLLVPATSQAQRSDRDPSQQQRKGSAATARGTSAAGRPGQGSVHSLLDEAGLVTSARHCPSCHAPMAADAVLCVQCGYNLRVGKRIETIAVVDEQTPLGAAYAGDWQTRAERALLEEKEEDRRKTGAGLPWWGYLIILLGIMTFTAAMLLIDPTTAMSVSGIIAMVVGGILTIVGNLWLLVMAFKAGILHGLLFLFIPFYNLVFLIMFWDDCAAPGLIWLGGIVLATVGFAMTLFAPYANLSDDSAALFLLRQAAGIAAAACLRSG